MTVNSLSVTPAKELPLGFLIAEPEISISSGVFAPCCNSVMDCLWDSVRDTVRVDESVSDSVAPVKTTAFSPLLSVIVIPDNKVADASMVSSNSKSRVPLSK